MCLRLKLSNGDGALELCMEATRYSTDHTSEDMFLGCMPYRQQNGSNAGIRAILQDRDGVGATLLCRGETREQAELVKRRDPMPSVQQRIDFTDALRRAPSASACFDLIGPLIGVFA